MKTYLIVGGSKGLGRAFIKQLIKEKKNRILLISRSNIDFLDEKIIYFQTNLLDGFSLASTLESIKNSYELDALVFFQKYRVKKDEKSNLIDEFRVNVEATKIVIETLQESFLNKGLRSIVVVGSIASRFVAQEQNVDYHITKSSLVGLVNYYAVSLAQKGIRINIVSPSTVLKDENRKFYQNNKELMTLYKSISPLKSIVQAKDVANLIKYLLSKKSKFITGQDIFIDAAISKLWQEAIGRKYANLENINIKR